MKRRFILAILTISVLTSKGQTAKIQISGRYKIDTLSDTGRYIRNPEQFITLLGRDESYYVGLLGDQKIYFRPADIVFSEDFGKWIQQKVQGSMLDRNKLTSQEYIDRYSEKNFRSALKIGQTMNVVSAILGEPTSKHKEVTKNIVNEKWIYNNADNNKVSYLFANGVLVKIGN